MNTKCISNNNNNKWMLHKKQVVKKKRVRMNQRCNTPQREKNERGKKNTSETMYTYMGAQNQTNDVAEWFLISNIHASVCEQNSTMEFNIDRLSEGIKKSSFLRLVTLNWYIIPFFFFYGHFQFKSIDDLFFVSFP